MLVEPSISYAHRKPQQQAGLSDARVSDQEQLQAKKTLGVRAGQGTGSIAKARCMLTLNR